MSVLGDWIPLGETKGRSIYYRKKEVYDMGWEMSEFSTMRTAIAPFGGPIAMVRDSQKIVRVDGRAKPVIRIYSSSGVPMAEIPWDKDVVVSLGWTEEEILACVTSGGWVHFFTCLGKPVGTHQFGIPEGSDVVVEAHVNGRSIVALTRRNQLYYIQDYTVPAAAFPMSQLPVFERPNCLEIVPSAYAPGGSIEVLVSPFDEVRDVPQQQSTEEIIIVDEPGDLRIAERGTILVVDGHTCSDQKLELESPIMSMKLSPNGQFLAVFTKHGHLKVLSSDFRRNLMDFDTGSEIPPKQLAWCANDAIVLFWDMETLEKDVSLMLMVTPNRAIHKFIYDTDAHLVTEIDGLRVITPEKCEFLDRVPDVLVDIFQIGSMAPAARLYDAYQEYSHKNSNCVKTVASIKESDELNEAVDDCIEGAAHVLAADEQKAVLRAASFGKSFLDFYSADKFVSACRAIRLLNMFRYWDVGIPMTMAQYRKLGEEAMVRRLTSRDMHLLAIRMCDYLGLPGGHVLVEWAKRKVASPLDNVIILGSIQEKLKDYSGIEYHKIAEEAFACGKSDLAIQLLENEREPSNQVDLLLRMNQYGLALTNAVRSGSVHLVYLSFRTILENKSDPEFLFRLVLQCGPLCTQVFTYYCRKYQPELLDEFLIRQADAKERGMFRLHRALLQFGHVNPGAEVTPADPSDLSDLSSLAVDSGGMNVMAMMEEVAKVGTDFHAGGRDLSSYEKYMEEYSQLLRVQREWSGMSHRGAASLAEVLYEAMYQNDMRTADKLRSMFKVSDKKFWWIKVRALADARNWEGLEKFAAKEKKSPIGFGPFIEVCIDHRNYYEAEKYIERLQDPRARADMLLKIGRYEQAGAAAMQARDEVLLQSIYDACAHNREIQSRIQLMIARLKEGTR
eukprot:TRINITY_DN251_c1_g2_i1.p1 TRINITY_DN251_c1_g2~~TRINITY_DN251_c1_g2_i1.p1  ORF type:complete len:899 (+),score=217.35 TRINITY_DN251_c1_g2_i1:92-2788(+)